MAGARFWATLTLPLLLASLGQASDSQTDSVDLLQTDAKSNRSPLKPGNCRRMYEACAGTTQSQEMLGLHPHTAYPPKWELLAVEKPHVVKKQKNQEREDEKDFDKFVDDIFNDGQDKSAKENASIASKLVDVATQDSSLLNAKSDEKEADEGPSRLSRVQEDPCSEFCSKCHQPHPVQSGIGEEVYRGSKVRKQTDLGRGYEGGDRYGRAALFGDRRRSTVTEAVGWEYAAHRGLLEEGKEEAGVEAREDDETDNDYDPDAYAKQEEKDMVCNMGMPYKAPLAPPNFRDSMGMPPGKIQKMINKYKPHNPKGVVPPAVKHSDYKWER